MQVPGGSWREAPSARGQLMALLVVPGCGSGAALSASLNLRGNRLKKKLQSAPSTTHHLRPALLAWQIVENEQVVLACFGCIQTNLNLVRPYLDRHQAADRGDSAQQLRPQLALRLSDHGSQARPASVFSQFTAGGEQLPAPGNGRGPSRGKGKQPAQPRKRKGESDEDYDDTVERRQRQQRQGQGRRSGQYGLPPNNGSDSDSLEAMLRPRSTGRRRQAANVS